ncbi:efflux RND transporter periplasmic adaptor subunit [Desulfosporosinus youngiae]|uniref:RND family efflux transporter, MFP subunit n=1 Tax=Desulfosporosinus youngiae DSM 17734 TaxID=768710 RepID=H5Y056_9FIRM|nr:RND family efflux transporter, MFP subunit [Desulfosporosinus youngiae DSM 17734]
MEKNTGRIRKILIPLIALMALGLLAGCGASKPTEAVEEKYIPVEVEVIAKKTLVNTAILSGKVSSETDVAVVPKVPGKVESVNVKVGDTVHAGQVLFSLETTDMNNTYQLAEARYQTSKEQWDNAKSSLERTKLIAAEKIADAQKNLANTKALYDAGAASKSQLDQVELALKDVESLYAGQIEALSVQASDASLKLAEVQLNQAREALDNAIVTAPVNGIVSQVNVQVGNMASSAQAAVSLTNTNTVYSSLSVAENLVNRLAQGQEVKVTVPSVSEQSFAGKIEHISPASDPQTRLYPVKITLDNPDGLIKPGMFAKVELVTDEKADVMSVKSEAVVLKNEKTIVYVVQEEKAVSKEVVTGLDTGVDIEILQGLSPGDQVIIKGQTLVDEGHKVKVVGGEES